MIVLFTDFGLSGPYTGQMKAVLYRHAPGVPVIDLFSDVPSFDPKAGAYLLDAYYREFPKGSVFLCVVDPGVGTGRRPLVMHAEGFWFVGPDNGLLSVVARRAADPAFWEITWRPERLSASFHGRDLFAPVAAKLALGADPPGRPLEPDHCIRTGWPEELAQCIYVDHYGNVMTGLRAQALHPNALLEVKGYSIPHARTFGDVSKGRAFWYENSNGLVEISVNQGSAVNELGLRVGDHITITAV